MPDPAPPPPRPTLRAALARLRDLLAWLRPPRRLRFTRAGAAFTAGAFTLGFAAINTGNNLLYLLLGAMLGAIALSGWMSEQALRGLELRRTLPRGVTAGRPAHLAYEVRNTKRLMPSFALELLERGLGGRAYVPEIAPRGAALARADVTFARRGVYTLGRLEIATSFPFGLFVKSRDMVLPGAIVVWPRTDREVREARPGGQRAVRSGPLPAGAAGGRSEYRGLKEYRPGDEPRDVHWRSSARLGELIVREYERDQAHTLWLCLDLRAPQGERAEAAVEIAAALAARAARRGERFGLATADGVIDVGTGLPQLERVLDALARARFRTDARALNPPAGLETCVLVTARAVPAAGFGDVFSAAREAA
ncbi:MAG: DUF58 domain-containing protein [Gemmatimonadetes bacterium]|nr:DUF58 domain-containing protein [Gemmatimonadota bacterium]